MPTHAQSLPDLLADAGIRVKRLTPGHNEHVICPRCGGGKSREVSLSVTIDANGGGAAWACHRGSCAYRDGGTVVRGVSRPATVTPRPVAIQSPKPHTPAQQENRPQWLWDFFGEREIGARTIKTFGVYAARHWFPDPVGETDAIVFPYLWKGELANRKYRPFPAKNPMQQDKNALHTLFNVDRLGDAPPEIVWVEGEPDVMALFECQIECAVSLKDGAPKEAKFKPDDKRFEALRTHGDMLAKAPKIILAGDMDPAGLALREELARRLGRHRCWLVVWPDGCKDACDTLRICGTEAVQACVRDARPYPIAGLQRIGIGTLLALRELPPPSIMTTGARGTDAILRLPTEGRLIVVTGYPGHGKTTWILFVIVHTAEHEGRRWAVFSPEMQPWQHFAAECAEVYLGKPFWAKGDITAMTDDEVVRAEKWLSGRIIMIVCDAEGEAPTLDWLLERFEATVLRDGVTDILIDPWNEIIQQRGEVSETDFIGHALQRLKAFAFRHGCNVWIVAHPAKPAPVKGNEKRPAPGLYDISGSSHWANKTDVGIAVHSPTPGSAEVHILKSRMDRWGKRGRFTLLDFDEITGRYRTPISNRFVDDPPSEPHEDTG
jgi:twinkle protein